MKVADIKRAACVGGGVIGSSWAIQFAMRGLAVTLYDINDEQLKRSEAQMHKSLDALEQFNAITPERRGEIVAAIRLTTSMEEAVADAQFIQESGPERLEIKQSILAQVEACAAADALYASSTSGLLISDIAAKAAHPERCVGAHPYNPPHLIPLVELTSGDKTDPALLRLAYDFYQSIGKEAVLLRRECPGFIANRLQLALYREVQDLVMRGVCSVEDADKALVYGFAPAVCIMMGFFTAVGGGMLRDGFMGVVPGIFQRTNFYAIAAIAGSASYVCLVMSGLVTNVTALIVCVAVTMGLRWLSLRFDIKSPTEEDIARFLHRKK